MMPKRQILSAMDMPKWKKSKAYSEYLNFIRNLNDSLKGSKLSDLVPVSPVCFDYIFVVQLQIYSKPIRQYSNVCAKLKVVQSVLKLLETLNKWVDETPPLQQPQRFGNQAFRIWFEKLKNVNYSFKTLLKKKKQEEKKQKFHYFQSIFKQRIRQI